MEIAIIHEDQDILAVDKAAGVDVYELQAELAKKYPDIKLAHRLDKETSGVIVLAKHEPVLRWLKQQFKERKVRKIYRALVVGNLQPEAGRSTGTISVSIGRHPSDPRRRDTGKRATPPRREATTHYQILKNFSHFTYVEVRPETGRTHQIRVHFKHIGHPIAGDKLYAPSATPPPVIGRQALHAYKLRLILPSGAEKEFVAPLPPDLQAAFAELERSC